MDSLSSSYESSEEGADDALQAGGALIDAASIVARAQRRQAVREEEEEEASKLPEGFQVDTGNLAVFCFNSIEAGDVVSNARLATQLLVNSVFDLPAQVTDTQVLVRLPEGQTVLPREKPVPVEEKLPTRWETFASRKGIAPKPKRSRRVWDEDEEKFRPRYGYGSKANQETDPWIVVMDSKGDQDIDAALLRNRKQRRLLVQKQLKQERRNAARRKSHTSAQTIPGNTTMPSFKGLSKEQKEVVKQRVVAQQKVARQSTASVGKFDNELRMAKEPKFKRGKQKRKLPRTLAAEKEQSLKVLDRLLEGEREKPLELRKAVNRHLNKKKRR